MKLGKPFEVHRYVGATQVRFLTDDIRRRQKAAARSMVRLGITFNVYGDAQGTERIIPFDIVPRIISGSNGGG